ncbi:unnamed protein product, partial [Toxocara canis]|uniref:Transposase n=1 Tax=Toxocara canis TaxID=6265 RepID=A0A183UGK4_TOXCA
MWSNVATIGSYGDQENVLARKFSSISVAHSHSKNLNQALNSLVKKIT